MPLDHPLANRDRLYLAETPDQDHVSLPPSSAAQRMLQRAAALRVVRAGLAISVLPAELARPDAQAFGLRVVPWRTPGPGAASRSAPGTKARCRPQRRCWWSTWQGWGSRTGWIQPENTAFQGWDGLCLLYFLIKTTRPSHAVQRGVWCLAMNDGIRPGTAIQVFRMKDCCRQEAALRYACSDSSYPCAARALGTLCAKRKQLKKCT
jgi:hypothetical protein